jgi:hypothetical protein
MYNSIQTKNPLMAQVKSFLETFPKVPLRKVPFLFEHFEKPAAIMNKLSSRLKTLPLKKRILENPVTGNDNKNLFSVRLEFFFK